MTSPPPDPPPDIRLVLRPLAGEVPVEIRLRQLLKYALRAQGFRLVALEEIAPDPKTPQRDGSQPE